MVTRANKYKLFWFQQHHSACSGDKVQRQQRVPHKAVAGYDSQQPSAEGVLP